MGALTEGVIAVVVMVGLPFAAIVIALVFQRALHNRQAERMAAGNPGTADMRAIRREVAQLRGKTLRDDLETFDARDGQ